MVGSLRVGIGWAARGRKSGFFPFWIGAIVVVASLSTWSAPNQDADKLFASWIQITQVLKVVMPITIYVGDPVDRHLLRSALLIAGFMRWLGRYGWLLTVAISIALPLLIYVTFGLVPRALPKGPVEDMLGL